MIRKARLFILVIFCTAVCGCGSSVTDSEEMDSQKHMEGMDQLLEGNTMGYAFSVYPEEERGELRLASWEEPLNFQVENQEIGAFSFLKINWHFGGNLHFDDKAY